ncbi:MAG: hypothetical protein ACRDC4_06720, partial [Plesiomonas sp.]
AGVLSTTPPEVDPATPPTPVPDAVQDPGGHIAASAGNRANGLGNMFGMPKMPEMPSPKEVEAKMMGEQAKQVMFDQNKIPEWHKSRAFSGGLLSLGLNLLSGNDLATSFAAAGEYFDKGFSKEKREAWANDLVEQGYDAQDIQRWIETGDNKDLTDPMEKKMKMMQYQTAEQNLANLQYESTPEMREYKRQMEQMPLRLQMQQMQQSQANANRTHDLALRKFEADQMKGAGYTYDPVSKGYKRSNLIGGKPLDKEGLKQLGYFGRAQNSVSEYENVFNKQGGIQAMQNRSGLGTFIDDMQMKALASDKGITPDLVRHMDKNQAELFDAQYGFITAVLRRESGAAISQSEWDRYSRMYFPRPSDTPEQIQYKSKLRAREMLTMNPNVTPDIIQAVDSGRLTDIRNIGGQTYVRDAATGQVIQL